MTKNRFKVSAIISTYNSEKFMRGCLQNLVEQTLYKSQELEIIVIDADSQENEQLIVKEFQANYSNIFYHRTSERETIYSAWNIGIKMARGLYITNTNTDDRHRGDALEVMMEYLDMRPEVSLIYADQLITTVANETFVTTEADRRWNWPPYSYTQLQQGCCMGSQPMWRKSLHEKYGYFNEDFHCAGDYEFWLRIGSKGEKMFLIPEILGLYYFNSQGLEHGMPSRAKEECDSICDQYNIPRLYIPKTSENGRKLSDMQYQGVLLTEEEKEQLILNQELTEKIFPIVVIDAIFFQLTDTGIARVWKSLIEEWKKSGFSRNIVVLDRANSFPRISGIKYRSVQAYDYKNSGSDSQMLQSICDEVRADLFFSTYYTTPISTPSIFLAHDMIPEMMNFDLSLPVWREKNYGILHACKYIAVSENTALDLVKFFPEISLDSISIAYNGIAPLFSTALEAEINQFKGKHQISKHYFIVVGNRTEYKNVEYFFKAFSQLENKQDLAIVCVGGNPQLEPEMANLVPDISTYMLKLSDEELKIAYSGAVALVYPSLYEGFGLPILEAMACGCPVITCRNSSIPEVAEEVALYVNGYNIDQMIDALSRVQDIHLRESLTKAGLKQSQKFSWQKMAKVIELNLLQTAQSIRDNMIKPERNFWFRYLRQEQFQLQKELQLEGEYQNLQREYQNSIKIAQDALVNIQAMESSKFWKLRNSWFKLKKLLRIKSSQ